jgi:hypothetical protein
MPIPALAIMLLPLIPKLIEGGLAIYETIRNHPDTPEEVKAQIDRTVMEIRATNALIQAAPLPGDEP